jgi:hypothetical protein
VVPDGPLRRLERNGELGRARGALTQEPDDPRSYGIPKRTELLRVGDDEDVVELVVRGMVDDRGTYEKSRPFATK